MIAAILLWWFGAPTIFGDVSNTIRNYVEGITIQATGLYAVTARNGKVTVKLIQAGAKEYPLECDSVFKVE